MLHRIMHALMLSSHCHSSPLRLRTIMHDIKCLQKWCHPHLVMTFPVLSFFPHWELCAGGIPLAFLCGDSWLWVRGSLGPAPQISLVSPFANILWDLPFHPPFQPGGALSLIVFWPLTCLLFYRWTTVKSGVLSTCCDPIIE